LANFSTKRLSTTKAPKNVGCGYLTTQRIFLLTNTAYLAPKQLLLLNVQPASDTVPHLGPAKRQFKTLNQRIRAKCIHRHVPHSHFTQPQCIPPAEKLSWGAKDICHVGQAFALESVHVANHIPLFSSISSPLHNTPKQPVSWLI
jgi:hypothetical protein